MENTSDNDSEDSVMLLYATIYDTIKSVLQDTRIPYTVKKEAQVINNALEGEVSTNVPELHKYLILLYRPAVLVFNQVSPATKAKVQMKDSVLGLVIQYVHKGEKPKGSVI